MVLMQRENSSSEETTEGPWYTPAEVEARRSSMTEDTPKSLTEIERSGFLALVIKSGAGDENMLCGPRTC
jgi:hypothetical protein